MTTTEHRIPGSMTTRTNAHPARAVLSVLERRDRLTQQLRETDAALRANARALLDAHGMRGMLAPEQLRRMAEKVMEREMAS